MIKDIVKYDGKEYQVSTVYFRDINIRETMIFPIEDGVVLGREVYCYRTNMPSKSQEKHKDILYSPEKYLSEKAIKEYLINRGYLIPKTNFRILRSMDIDEFAEWLDENGAFDNSPWLNHFTQKYCENCESIECKYEDAKEKLDITPFYDDTIECAYCEIYNKCRYFENAEEIPDNLEMIKLWLEAEVEE